jgi:membrane protein
MAGPGFFLQRLAMELCGAETLSILKRIRLVISGSVSEWISQRAASKGAVLSFYTLFSMTPILVLVIAIAGAVFGKEAAQGEIFSQLQA